LIGLILCLRHDWMFSSLRMRGANILDWWGSKCLLRVHRHLLRSLKCEFKWICKLSTDQKKMKFQQVTKQLNCSVQQELKLKQKYGMLLKCLIRKNPVLINHWFVLYLSKNKRLRVFPKSLYWKPKIHSWVFLSAHRNPINESCYQWHIFAPLLIKTTKEWWFFA